MEKVYCWPKCNVTYDLYLLTCATCECVDISRIGDLILFLDNWFNIIQFVLHECMMQLLFCISSSKYNVESWRVIGRCQFFTVREHPHTYYNNALSTTNFTTCIELEILVFIFSSSLFYLIIITMKVNRLSERPKQIWWNKF